MVNAILSCDNVTCYVITLRVTLQLLRHVFVMRYFMCYFMYYVIMSHYVIDITLSDGKVSLCHLPSTGRSWWRQERGTWIAMASRLSRDGAMTSPVSWSRLRPVDSSVTVGRSISRCGRGWGLANKAPTYTDTAPAAAHSDDQSLSPSGNELNRQASPQAYLEFIMQWSYRHIWSILIIAQFRSMYSDLYLIFC